VTTPAMLSDLIARRATGRIELDVVAELDTRDGMIENLRRLCPDLVVIGLRPTETGAVACSLLEYLPGTKFITLSADGRSILGYEHRIHRVELTDAPREALIDFLGGTPREKT